METGGMFRVQLLFEGCEMRVRLCICVYVCVSVSVYTQAHKCQTLFALMHSLLGDTPHEK